MDKEFEDTKEFPVRICNACYNLEDGMCHNPYCVFIRCTRAEVREYLDRILIRPIVDGVSLNLLIKEKD